MTLDRTCQSLTYMSAWVRPYSERSRRLASLGDNPAFSAKQKHQIQRLTKGHRSHLKARLSLNDLFILIISSFAALSGTVFIKWRFERVMKVMDSFWKMNKPVAERDFRQKYYFRNILLCNDLFTSLNYLIISLNIYLTPTSSTSVFTQ